MVNLARRTMMFVSAVLLGTLGIFVRFVMVIVMAVFDINCVSSVILMGITVILSTTVVVLMRLLVATVIALESPSCT